MARAKTRGIAGVRGIPLAIKLITELSEYLTFRGWFRNHLSLPALEAPGEARDGIDGTALRFFVDAADIFTFTNRSQEKEKYSREKRYCRNQTGEPLRGLFQNGSLVAST